MLTGESWSNFRRRIATEALQWRQYNLFSRQLTLRLALRYKGKRVSLFYLFFINTLLLVYL